MYAFVDVKTLRLLPLHVLNVRFVNTTASSVSLAWDPPRIPAAALAKYNQENSNQLGGQVGIDENGILNASICFQLFASSNEAKQPSETGNLVVQYTVRYHEDVSIADKNVTGKLKV
jgi:hypothetical protein